MKRLRREKIDLLQIHCPPLEILQDGQVFHVLDQLQAEGIIKHYGVSVESVEEGLECLKHPALASLQIIYNIFRQKPLQELIPKANQQDVGLIIRLPLASELLTGKFTKATSFDKDDHRHFNQDGEHFNVGETFAGLPFEKAVDLVESISWITEKRETMSRAALRWILDHDQISCVIPGFKNVEQIKDNLQSEHVPPFSSLEKEKLNVFYREKVAQHIRGSY